MIITENNKVEIHDYNNKIRGFERVSGFDKAILPVRKTAGSCGYDIHIYSATPTTIKSHDGILVLPFIMANNCLASSLERFTIS